MAVFSPKGRLVLTAGVDGDARTWRAANGALANVLSGHVSVISKASFSRDGRWIITAGPGAGGLWETATGERLFFLRGHVGPLRAAGFSPDGRWVVTGGVDGGVRTYQCTVCGRLPDLQKLAAQRLRVVARSER
jgi:WD40 repeat protein